LTAQSDHPLNLIGRGCALFALASTAPFIEPDEPARRSGPTLERFCARR